MSNKPSRSPQDPHAQREAERYSKPIASREHIHEIIASHRVPCTQARLEAMLQITEADDQEALRRRLAAMVRDGQLVLNRREGYLPVDERNMVRGRVIAHPDGFGFLHPESGGEDLFIPPKQMRALLHDDRVIMRVTGVDRRGRREVALVDVLERANSRLVGRLRYEGGIAHVVVDNKRFTQEVLIPADAIGGAIEGQIVVAEITEQPTLHHPPIGRITEVLGEKMDPGMEIDIAIISHDIPNSWNQDVLQEAAALGAEVAEADKQNRLDLRDKPLVTIDGEDARDFDDAVYCEQEGSGWRLYVAIADVSHYVRQESALDTEAASRGTSVYFPQTVIPMLPEAISNGLCSLNPKVDRLCMVCILDIDSNGIVKQHRFHEAVMCSQARLTYTEVAAAVMRREIAARKQLAHLLPHLERLYTLYKVLQKRRDKRGAIEFETTETRIIYGVDKKIESIVPLVRNDAHRIIEECMIAANIAAAEFLARRHVPCLYRVHEPPPADKLEDLATFLGELGIKFPRRKSVSPKQLSALLKSIRGRTDEHLIQTVALRSMSQAVYQPNNLGHFGLALETYAHFTSPIRRYPDLMVHRAIRHVLRGGTADNFPYTPQAVSSLGEHSSMTERRADEATRDAVDWLKCEYLLDKVGQEYDGIISGVASFGIFIELEGIYVEGLAHVTSLPKDYYHFDPIAHKLTGERSGRVFQLGDRVHILVSRVSLDDRQIDFEVLHAENNKQRKRRRQ
ncbi:MAG: ribonuclease R [Gammaproteobacteria bacterium]|nr:ribonuclease R [Gammaproteobacteria bacterium]